MVITKSTRYLKFRKNSMSFGCRVDSLSKNLQKPVMLLHQRGIWFMALTVVAVRIVCIMVHLQNALKMAIPNLF